MLTINRKNKMPYYQQLYEILREKIACNDWKPGDMLPTEAELIDQHKVSRNTVRDVMDMLVNEGLIYRQRGRGTFVAQSTVEQGLVRIISFTEDMRQRGLTASSIVLSKELLPAPEDIAEKLQVKPGEELGLLKRLRLGNNEPMNVEESYFIHRYCPGFLDRHDYSTTSLRESMLQDYGIRWLHATQVIRAVSPTRELSLILKISPKIALLSIERVTYNDRDTPVEFLRIYYRGDRYTLFNELRV
jgi:GntR family transcriptional regulator